MAKRPLDSVRFAAERFVLSTRCQKISDRTLKELSNGIQLKLKKLLIEHEKSYKTICNNIKLKCNQGLKIEYFETGS